MMVRWWCVVKRCFGSVRIVICSGCTKLMVTVWIRNVRIGSMGLIDIGVNREGKVRAIMVVWKRGM